MLNADDLSGPGEAEQIAQARAIPGNVDGAGRLDKWISVSIQPPHSNRQTHFNTLLASGTHIPTLMIQWRFIFYRCGILGRPIGVNLESELMLLPTTCGFQAKAASDQRIFYHSEATHNESAWVSTRCCKKLRSAANICIVFPKQNISRNKTRCCFPPNTRQPGAAWYVQRCN